MNKILYNDSHGGYRFSKEFEKFFNLPSWEIEELPRHDPKLIEAVEAFGLEAASDKSSSLAIATIEGNTYKIEEYDGLEWVATPELIDWITI